MVLLSSGQNLSLGSINSSATIAQMGDHVSAKANIPAPLHVHLGYQRLTHTYPTPPDAVPDVVLLQDNMHLKDVVSDMIMVSY